LMQKLCKIQAATLRFLSVLLWIYEKVFFICNRNLIPSQHNSDITVT